MASNSEVKNSAPVKSTRMKRTLHSYSFEYKLKIISEAKKSSNRQVSRTHHLDESQVRRWVKDEAKLLAKCHKKPKNMKRCKLDGGGRKVYDEELEDRLFLWVIEHREKHWRVTSKGIMKKAMEMLTTENFTGSRGWCWNFMQRYGLSLRQKTHQSQQLPKDLAPKVVSFLSYMRKTLATNKYSLANIVAMDETAVWFDSTSSKTITFAGQKTVSLASTGRDKQVSNTYTTF